MGSLFARLPAQDDVGDFRRYAEPAGKPGPHACSWTDVQLWPPKVEQPAGKAAVIRGNQPFEKKQVAAVGVSGELEIHR